MPKASTKELPFSNISLSCVKKVRGKSVKQA